MKYYKVRFAYGRHQLTFSKEITIQANCMTNALHTAIVEVHRWGKKYYTNCVTEILKIETEIS